jgi:hypothetical protein
MKHRYLSLLFMLLCVILVLAAGCTSPVQPEENRTPSPTATITPVASASDALRDLALSPEDLPPGYSLVYRGEMRPGEPNCTAQVCFLQGYFITASNGINNTSTVINQAIVIYDADTTPASLRPVLEDQLRDFAATANLTPLPDPGIGDASALYRFSREDYGEGYLLIFGKGNVYEIIMVWGPDASETMVVDLAKKALS